MARRDDLQAILVGLLGSSNVYFQPPPTIKLEYPCIVYKRDDIRTEFADNVPYNFNIRYQIMVIARDPDNLVVAKIAGLPLCRYERFYTAENLNHDVFNLFF